MNLNDIRPVIEKISNNLVVSELREHTYLSTYPHIIDMAVAINQNSRQQFHHLALMAYGWMPRVLRIDPIYTQLATTEMVAARNSTIANYNTINIQHIASCLNSLVGASKLLHFINPDVFPIWDSKIQGFCGRNNSQNAMRDLGNYLEYVDEVHLILEDPGFEEFYNDYLTVNEQRLTASNINQYLVCAIRATEASAFELSSE